jgi:hypothetical protein
MIEDLSVGCADSYPVHNAYIFAESSHQDGMVVCDHDFEGAVGAVESESDGWRGFLLVYHCGDEPWKDARWELEDLGEFIQQVELGARSAPKYCDKAKITKLLDFLRQAHKNGQKIFLECR